MTEAQSRASTRLLGATWAVVVNWNGGTAANSTCLESLREQGLPWSRLVFVDNGSGDGSLDGVRSAFAGIHFIENGSNLGFGEGANIGARFAMGRGAEAVLFVNNDLRFPGDHPSLRLLCDAMEQRPSLGLCGPRVLFDGESPARVWCAGGRLDYRQNLSTLLGHGEPDHGRWRRSFGVDYVAGCALLARASVLQDLGLFDASYFAYMEDVELGLRVRRAGCGVMTIGEALAYHAPSSSTGGGYSPRRKWMQGVNSVRFLKTHGGPGAWVRFFVFDVATLPLAFVVRAFRGEWRGVAAKAKGLLDGLRGRRVSADALEPGGSWLWPRKR